MIFNAEMVDGRERVTTDEERQSGYCEGVADIDVIHQVWF